MSLIIYTKEMEASQVRLQLVPESVADTGTVEVLNRVDDLTHRLLKAGRDSAVVVLVTRERRDLAELLPVLQLLRKVKIILVLPDRQPETIKIGYHLEPRFLSYMDCGFEKIKAVVEKMHKGLSPTAGDVGL
jgi:hypothetical protein